MWVSSLALSTILFILVKSEMNVGNSSDEKLLVTVYYESLCPASKDFVATQVYPTFRKVKSDLVLDLIPYGHTKMAKSHGKWIFKCQHGPKECYGNKIQSCVLDNSPIDNAVGFIGCAMGSSDPSSNSILEDCATKTQVDWTDIETCISTGQGDKLLAINGKKTDKAKPPITYVPEVYFNGQFDENLNNKAREDLLAVVCKLLKNKPIICLKLQPDIKIIY